MSTSLIPIADENPTRRLPVVTVALIAANVAVFAWEAGLPPDALNAFLTTHAFVPARFAQAPLTTGSLASVLISMFLHGGWLHLGGNMLYLWIFGNNIEDRLGPVGFAIFYLATGIAATLAQFAAGPYVDVPNIGASGAVAGVLGAYLLLYPGAQVLTLIPLFFVFTTQRLSAFFVIVFWFALQLANGVASLGAATASDLGGVAWFAHVGGFVAGLALALPAWAVDRRRMRGLRR